MRKAAAIKCLFLSGSYQETESEIAPMLYVDMLGH